MYDNTSFKVAAVAIMVWKGGILEVHPHAPILPIRRSHEVGVVESGTILSVSNNCIILGAKVVLLEIACKFVKSIPTISGQ